VPKRDIATIEAETLSEKLQEVLSDAEVEKAARRCGFLRRRREIAPAALLVACISTLGAGTAAWLADILRAFNAFTGKAVRYKPFHNQLSKRRFPIFVHAMLEQVLAKLTAPVLESLPKGTIKRAITHAAERACGTELSTQRAACSAKHFLDDILAALLDPGQKLLRDIRAAFVFLARNALRSHPERDRRTGRLAAGLHPVGAQTIS
jgi:hypothetical protein